MHIVVAMPVNIAIEALSDTGSVYKTANINLGGAKSADGTTLPNFACQAM